MEIRDQQVSELMLAADDGDVARVRSLLKQGLSVDVEDGAGQTALMKTWDMPMVNALLEAGADFHRRDRDGCTALHHACRDRRLNKMRRLLEAGADLFLANKSGQCPLGLFLETGWYKIAMDLLEEYGPDTDLSVLQEKVGDPDLPWKLALKGFGKTKSEIERGRRLLEAIKEGSLSRVEAVLSEGSIVELTDPYELTPVGVAVNSRRCDSHVVGALLKAGARTGAVSSYHPLPLEWAVRKGRKVMVLLLDPEYPMTEALERSIFFLRIVDDGNLTVRLYPNHPRGLVSMGRLAPRSQEGGWERSGGKALEKNRDFLKEAKVSWLVPYLERIAGGEPTPVSEIEEEYEKRYGKPLPIGRFAE